MDVTFFFFVDSKQLPQEPKMRMVFCVHHISK